MKRDNIMMSFKEKCSKDCISLYLELEKEISDFFYKYELFTCDNVYLNIYNCLNSNEYMSYLKISEKVALDVKGVTKFIKNYESFVIKILNFPKYEKIKSCINSTK